MFLPSSSSASAIEDGLDYPAGKPNGTNYSNGSLPGGNDGWGFLEFNGSVLHPGEDWNRGSGSDDYGDPLYSAASGTVVASSNYGGNWGKVVLIKHHVTGIDAWSQYAHLSTVSVDEGDSVSRGQLIGKIGDAEGRWASHLHFELRRQGLTASFWPKTGWQASKMREYYLDPSEFIKANRPLPPPTPQKLAIVASGKNGAEVSWDEAKGKEFERYELYRSDGAGEKGSKIFSATDAKTLAFKDTNLFAEQDYYYRLYTFYKNGLSATSNEVTIKIKRETTNISNAPGVQRHIGINGNKIYWENNYRDQTNFPTRKNFYYYDLDTRTATSMPIGIITERIDGPYKPQIGAEWLCYSGKKSSYGNYEIFCRNLASDIPVDIQITTYNGDDGEPQVSEDGILVWQGGYSGAKRVYWTDLNNGTQINEVTTTVGYQSQPRIWGKNIIWAHQAAVGAQKDLYYKNIETGAEGALASDIDDGTVDLWDGYITYTKGGKLQLTKIFGLENVATIAQNGLNAGIRDGKVVYAKLGSDAKYHVYVYIISTEKTIDVSGPLKYQPSPVIYENMIAYDASPIDASTDMDIYLTYL